MLTKVIVLKSFPYSSNGVSISNFNPSSEPVEIADAVVAGLEAEGFVRRADVTVATAPPSAATAPPVISTAFTPVMEPLVSATVQVGGEIIANGTTETSVPEANEIEIPENWRSMKWFGLKALAKSVSGTEPKDGKEAAEFIEAELAARSAKQTDGGGKDD